MSTESEIYEEWSKRLAADLAALRIAQNPERKAMINDASAEVVAEAYRQTLRRFGLKDDEFDVRPCEVTDEDLEKMVLRFQISAPEWVFNMISEYRSKE
jgi:hypothetical protein